METKFNFKTQVATSRVQSERLLALGLKKETADMVLCDPFDYEKRKYSDGYAKIVLEEGEDFCKEDIPAWSLARILELMPESIDYKNKTLYLTIYGGDVFYTNWQENTPLARTLDVYEHLIFYIEWLIKEGYFNKEYLV